ncbi:ferredoxin reductase family protein [Nocardia sp. R16R-3T]
MRSARVDAAVRCAAGVALWGSVLTVVYWWVAGGGIQDLGIAEDRLTSTGRLAGLVAADLLLAQVLLIARIPFLENAFGRDRLIALHRLIGGGSFGLLIGHIALITWGYAGGALIRTPVTLWELTVDYPGMLLAVAGTTLLMLVVVTSMRAVRERLRYETWHLLHLYAYLGVGLALPHQLWTGQEFLNSPAATAYWWSAWALAVVAVLTWRFALPLWRNAIHRLRVTAVVPEGDDVWSVYLSGRRLDRLPVAAGQFCTWRFLNRPGWTRGNPYSLSAMPNGEYLRVSIKAAGDNSMRTSALRPGTPVLFEGPYGRLSPRTRTRRGVVLIGAGVGLAPMRALAEGIAYAPGEAVALLRYRSEPLFAREFEYLASTRGLRLHHLPGHRRGGGSWLGDSVGRVDDRTALLDRVPDIAARDVYVCGPLAWSESVRRTARAAGVPESRIHVENFRW